jgi:uncharacterized phage protein (TIGR02218 family)
VCVKLTRRDAQVFGVTALDRDLVVSGITYKSLNGIDATDATTGSDMQVDNVDVTSGFNAGQVTEGDLAAGVWDGCRFELFAVNWRVPTDGVEILKTGEIGDVKHGRLGFQATLVGLTAKLQNNVGRIITPTCNAVFGDARCGFNKASVTASAQAVTSVTSQTVITLSGLAAAPAYYDDGDITGVAGANAGIVREIKAHTTGGVLTLHQALPFAVVASDTFNVAPGCRKRKIEDCKTRWNNIVNFRGFAELPGLDALLKVVQ